MVFFPSWRRARGARNKYRCPQSSLRAAGYDENGCSLRTYQHQIPSYSSPSIYFVFTCAQVDRENEFKEFSAMQSERYHRDLIKPHSAACVSSFCL